MCTVTWWAPPFFFLLFPYCATANSHCQRCALCIWWSHMLWSVTFQVMHLVSSHLCGWPTLSHWTLPQAKEPVAFLLKLTIFTPCSRFMLCEHNRHRVIWATLVCLQCPILKRGLLKLWNRLVNESWDTWQPEWQQLCSWPCNIVCTDPCLS